MRNTIITIIVLIFLSGNISNGYCQDVGSDSNSDSDGKPYLRERIFFGGNFWLQFGNITFIDISPIVGYRITERFSSGVGYIYRYYKENLYYQHNAGSQIHKFIYKSNIYGGKLFSQYTLVKSINDFIPIDIGSIIAHIEYNLLNVDTYITNSSGLYLAGEERKWINVFLVGGGISQPLGRRSSVNIMVLWDLIEDDFSPYPNPTFRIGFNF